MANRYSNRQGRGERGQQGYFDDEGSRQYEQFDQRSDMQYGDESYGVDYQDRNYRRGAEARFQQPRQGRQMSNRDFEGERGYGERSYRGSGSYDPLSDYDRDDNRQRGGFRDTMRDRNFREDFDNDDRNRSRYGGRNRYGRGDYSPYERDRDERGFFDRAGDEIASWFGDDEAERRREQDYRRQQNERARQGESHRGRGPSNYNRSDERMLEDACERLTHDHGVDASDMEVTVKNGELTLDGKVNTRWEKRRAEDCVHDVSGVNHVQNNLRIRETDMRSDRNDQSRTDRDSTKSRTDTTTGTLA
ncbi:BON domain-containing protein [Aurantiacibacter poecillastricola]|uniref:BON domain-containing protein n=1 Tax=Aurantiacibacter poecillastricola TaxID=3064385 RepID=UPI00273EB19C|nr:SWFGD domain-containing protein [Aurantiacibacter sp. 219JJ12-13]MDP5260363.1 SWFGD domain-containing protein [Aurantiacibacter sp. 219JJ12-13]